MRFLISRASTGDGIELAVLHLSKSRGRSQPCRPCGQGTESSRGSLVLSQLRQTGHARSLGTHSQCVSDQPLIIPRLLVQPVHQRRAVRTQQVEAGRRQGRPAECPGRVRVYYGPYYGRRARATAGPAVGGASWWSARVAARVTSYERKRHMELHQVSSPLMFFSRGTVSCGHHTTVLWFWECRTGYRHVVGWCYASRRRLGYHHWRPDPTQPPTGPKQDIGRLHTHTSRLLQCHTP